MKNPRRLIFIGGGLLVVGWIIPLLMVMDFIPPSFPLAFSGYAASMAGLVTGLIGVYTYFPFRRRR